MSLKDVEIVCDVALPPVSRKLAEVVEKGGEERRRWRVSLVFIARPAPFTSVPTRFLGSSAVLSGGVWVDAEASPEDLIGDARGTKTMPLFSASRIVGEMLEVSRRACRSDWRLLDL